VGSGSEHYALLDTELDESNGRAYVRISGPYGDTEQEAIENVRAFLLEWAEEITKD
jgi:hypothetical protein